MNFMNDKSLYCESEVFCVFCTESKPLAQVISTTKILRSIISQTLWHNNHYITTLFPESSQGKELNEMLEISLCNANPTIENLGKTLETALRYILNKVLYVVIDGIDALEPKAQLELFHCFWNLRNTLQRKPTIRAKFLLSCSKRQSIGDADFIDEIQVIDK